MKKFIVYSLLGILLSIVVFPSFAQQNQNTSQQEIEALKKQISEIQSKLQTVENVEKMELAAKLAEAETRLNDTEIEKYKRGLKDENDKWLREWTAWFIVIIGLVGAVFWFWLRLRADKLIEKEVGKSLKRFQESVKKTEKMSEELRMVQKQYAVSVIENYIHFSADESYYSEILNTLPEQALIDVFAEEMFPISVKHVAAEVLVNMQSTEFVSHAIDFINSVDLDLYLRSGLEVQDNLRKIIRFLGHTQDREAYEGLKKFMNRLLTENPNYKQLFLTSTVFSLAEICTKLGIGELSSDLKNLIQELDFRQRDTEGLMNLAVYFDKFNEPDGIIEMVSPPLLLIMGLTEVENKCMDLLRATYPAYVEQWLAIRHSDNTESENDE